MNVSVVDLSETQKKLQVTIPSGTVREELDRKYRDLARQVKIKGFRPGKVPRSILKSYYGKVVEGELSSKFVQESFHDALLETDLKPLTEADVSEVKFEEDGSFTYTAIVDVSPPFVVEDYRGIPVHHPVPEVSESMVDLEIERLREQNSQLRTVEEQRPIREGDIVMVDLTPFVDGSVFEKGKTEGYLFQVGKGTVHPDLDPHLVSRTVGESLSVDLDYPQEGTLPEIAGKRVRMDLVIKDLKEKIVPEVNDDFARESGKCESVQELREALRDQIRVREHSRIEADVRNQIINHLLERVTLDLPDKAVEGEVDAMVGHLQHQLERQGIKLDATRFNTPEVRADYRPQAERNLRQRLIFEQIARQEQIRLSDEEVDEIVRQVASMARVDVETVLQHPGSALVEQAKEGKIQEKVLDFLVETSVSSDDTNPPAPEEA